jgi:hypothetical protein
MNDIRDAERQALATELGYRKIGKELPDNISLNDVVQSMPKEVGRSRKRPLMWPLTIHCLLKNNNTHDAFS